MKRSTILTNLITGLFLLTLFSFQKWNAYWGDVNVLLVSVLSAPALAVLFKLFIDKQFLDNSWGGYYYPDKFFWLLFFGVGISTALGVEIKEPRWESSKPVVHEGREYQPAVYYNRYYYRSTGTQSIDLPIPDLSGLDSGDDGGEGIAFLLLLLLVIILVVGSAFIAHFWVWSGIFMLTLMWLFYHNNEL